MSRTRAELIAFNGGEIGKKTLARTDLDTYARCAETMENIWPTPSGDMSKMPGTIYIAAAPAGEVALRSFEYSVSDNLIMVWSDESLKLIYSDAYLAIEGATATLGTFSDESAATSTGGGSAPDLTPPTIDWTYSPYTGYGGLANIP